jgi:hypothetical protein
MSYTLVNRPLVYDDILEIVEFYKEIINLIKYLAPNDYLKLKLQQAEQYIINHKTKPAHEVIDCLRQNLF